MDKLDQVRGVLRGIKNIAVQGIYADTFKGIEAQCVSTYRKCVATLKTIEGYEDTEGLAPELTDNATMQEIGFAVEMVLSLISEGNAAAINSGGMRGWDWKARHMPPVPPTPPIPPMPPMPGGRHMRSVRHHMRQQIRSARRPGRGSGAEDSRRLAELQDEMQEKIEEEQERFEENVESMEEKMEELQEKIEEMRERLQERLEEIRERYEEKVEEMQEAAEEAEKEAEEEEDDEDEDVDEPKI